MKRKLVGRYNDLVTRQSVYEQNHALEIDEHEGFQIRRRRVFFEDVLLVTMHERTSVMGVLFGFGMAFFFFLIALAVGKNGGFWVMLFGLPFLAYGIACIRGIQYVVTVFGKRSRARMKIRRAHARRIYDAICEKVTAAQQPRESAPLPEQ